MTSTTSSASSLQTALLGLVDRQDRSASEIEEVMLTIMQGGCTEAQIAAWLTGLAMKGPTADELAGAARAMRQRATPIKATSQSLLDTCGTGGDGQSTFNISTATAFVVAACGVPVAKHGNRSLTSKSGSADVLEALGVNITLSPEAVGACIDEVGIGFCFAPLLHGAMKYATPVRKQLPFRTIFNLLGPLSNPAGAAHQLLGVSRPNEAALVAQALAQLGTRRSIVVSGDHLDEITLWGETHAWIVETLTPGSLGTVEEVTWTARDFGLPECRVEDLRVESPVESAAVLQRIFANEPGPARDIVIANAAAGLLAAGKVFHLRDGVELARMSVETGRVRKSLESLVGYSNHKAC